MIISTLMELASEAGLIACVFSHYSQLSSMKGNLKTFQKKRFNKDLLTLPYQLKDLGDKTVLETVKNRLLEAKRKRCGLIMKSNFPQIVQLKFILDCFRLKSIEDISSKNAFLMHLKSLAEILDIFEKDIVSFIDECDLILSLLTEVNVPFGEAKMVAPERVDLVAAIYQILIRPEVREKLRLLKDEQKGVRPHTLRNEIYPFVAEELFKYSSFGLESYPDLKEAFCRHLKEEILHEDQVLADDLSQPLDSIPEGIQKENVKFLRLMQEWSESQERYQKEAAELVGLTRHMFASVLPIAFSKSYNRNIGPLYPDHPNGAIIPYEGPDSPAKTKIGYLYLSLACHLQAALGSGIAKDEIVFLADKMMIAAQNFAIRDKITLLETEEAIQFYQLTGIQLNEVSIPEKLKEACDYVNDPHFPERCIKLRQEVAPFHVQYYPDYVSSNSLSFIDQIARPIACSGTDYNSKSFHPKVGTMTPDSGSGGSIINAVEERDFAQSSTHVVPNTSLDSLMEVIKNHPEKHRIRSIIDAGGYLKGGKSVNGESHSQRMAIHPNIKRLLDFFQETPGTNIEAVIYLHHYTQEEIKNENAPEEAFVLVKRGESQHIRLADTTSATIAKTKIPLEKIFFLLDEPRSTGTDFKMHSDTLCLLTIDLDAPMRTLLQTTQRAREYFKKQHVEFCLTNEGVESVLGGKRTMDVVNQFLIMNEAVMISDLTFRSYLLQLPNIPRAHVVRSLCAAALKEDAKTVNSLTENYSDYLISHQGEEKLWQNFGRVAPKTSVVKFLEDKKTRISNDLTEKDDALLMEFNEISAAIVAKAANEPMLPTHIKGNAAEKLDNEVELVQEHEIDLDLDQDLTINQELQQDLTSYNLIGVGSNPYDEKPWKLDLKDGRLCFDDLKPSINPIQDVCKKQFPVPGKNPVTLEQFAECFEDHVYMTSNLQSVYVTPIPILHHDAKQVDFVLFVREDDKTHCILVSKKDAGFFKRWIRQNKPSNTWLVNLDGIPEAENEPGAFETLRSSNKVFNTRIQNGLWQANFYQGNIRYLEEHHRLSIHNIKSKRKLFGQYLALRNAYDSHKLQTTLRSFLIDVQSLSRKGIGGLLFSARREKMKKTYNEFLIYTQEQVAVINPELVTNLWPHQIPWLTTQEQISNLHEDAVNSLDPSQVHLLSDHQIEYLTNAGLIAVLPKEKIRLLRKEQVYHLKSQEQIQALPNKFLNSIAPECVQFLKHTKIKHLKRPELIAEIDPDHVPYMTISQVPHLKTAAQIEKLPDDLINEVLPQHVDKLSAAQIPLLTKEELIVVIPVDKITFIMPQQVHVLTEAQIKAILSNRGDLIREIPLPKVSYVTPLQVPQLGMEQVRQLMEDLIDSVSEEQIAWLKDEQFTYLRKPESIRKIPLDKLNFICAEQVPHLDENQVKLMEDKWINHLVPAQVQFILDDKIRLLQKPTLIAAIHPDKVFGNIVEGQFKYLIESQLANVPDHLNHWFDEYLIPEQVPLIPDNKVALLKRPELIEALLPRQIPHICVEQVKDLTREEQIPAIPIDRIDLIQAIPENAVNFGHIDHIMHYTENQVKAMTEDADGQKIEAIALDKIGHIQPQLVHYLTPDQIKAIPDDAYLLIQQIPLDKINHIRPEHVPHLTPEQIKAIPDNAADLIQQVPLDKINHIRSEQVPHLTPSQIAAIPDDPLFHIHQIPLDNIKHIRPEHVPHLTPNQVKAIPDNAVGLIQQVRLNMIEFVRPQHIPHLTPAQIAAIPEDMILLIQEIPAAKIPHIRPGHVPHLTPDQIQAIPNDASELIQKIPLDKINHIRPEHIPHLTPPQIASIPHNFVGLIQQIPLGKINHIRPEHVPHLAPAQFAAIPDNAVGLIQQIPLHKINHIRPEHVPHLTPAQIAAIPDNAVGLIQQIPVNKIPHIKTSHVPHLTVTQIKAISTYAQEHIQQIPLDKIGDIRPEQVLQLTQTQIQAIPNNATHLIQRISLNKMAHIKPDHVPHLTSIQIQSLPENAANLIQQIPTNKVQHILPKHVPHLTLTQIKAIQEFAIPLIQKIPTVKISHINPGLVPHLTEEQIKALPDDAEELIQNIPLNKISYIRPEHVPHLMHTQIQAIHDHAIPLIQSIPASKIAQIRPEHVPHLTPTQIEALPDDNVDLIESIPTDQLSHIRPEHVPHVPAKNLYGIPTNRPDLIKQIPESNISQIMPGHVKHLTQKQIQAIPLNNPNLIHNITNEQVPFVSPEQVSALNSEQIHFLKDPKFIKKIPTKMIPQVTVEQVPHLDKNQIAHLPDHLFDHLTIEQLSLVPDDKIYLLNNPKLIAGLPNNKIPYVMDDQIQYLTNDHLQYLPMELELLLNVPEARRKYLTNEHLKKIYTPKNAVEALYNIVKGVTASLFGMGIQLPFWTVANFIWLALLTVGAVFSKKAGKKWNAQCKETFVNTPVRKMLFVKIIYDYPGYKRSSWKWNQPSVAPAA